MRQWIRLKICCRLLRNCDAYCGSCILSSKLFQIANCSTEQLDPLIRSSIVLTNLDRTKKDPLDGESCFVVLRVMPLRPFSLSSTILFWQSFCSGESTEAVTYYYRNLRFFAVQCRFSEEVDQYQHILVFLQQCLYYGNRLFSACMYLIQYLV